MMKITPDRSLFDHMLVTLGATMAVFAASMSLGKPGNAVFFGFAVIALSLIGYGVGWLLRNTPAVRYDAYLWAIIAIGGTSQVFRVNTLAPDPEITRNLIIVPILSWMLVLCSLVSWRDQTLLFLTLPSLALFGLVGTFENYPPGTVMFFGFLIASALLYARVHHRGMIQRAQSSGVTDPALLYRDSWRWMAGPEWALASAGGIVLLSLIAAPLLQFSLQGVSGTVAVTLPGELDGRVLAGPTEALDRPIGQGPVRLDDRPVFKIRSERIVYLRLDSFSFYRPSGWANANPDWGVGGLPSPSLDAIDRRGPGGGVEPWPGGIAPSEPIERFERLRLEVRSVGEPLAGLPAPHPIVEVFSLHPPMRAEANGAVRFTEGFPQGASVAYDVAVPTRDPRQAAPLLPSLLAGNMGYFQTITSEAFIRFVTNATAEHTSPFEKAHALERAISVQARYNVRAPRVPIGTDPVEFFLFESREGYCDLFATSMVLGARLLGMPARYVTGYIINDGRRDRDGFLTVRARDAHAWAEVHFEGVGWVVFDPTENAIPVEGGERGAANVQIPWWREPWFTWILNGLMVAGVLAVVLFLVFNRGGARLGAVIATDRPEVARLHTAFQRALEAHVRFPRRFSMTTAEFVQVAAPKLGRAAPRAEAMSELFQRAFYAQSPPDAVTLRRLGTDLRALRSELKAERQEPRA